MQSREKKLICVLLVLLVGGFLATSMVSYYMAVSSIRKQISSSSLPLTSDNIYSEIQRDLLRPVFIASMMSNDTFLKDWVISGEKDTDKITKYLKEIMVKYNTFTSFFVSEKTRIYYHANGILKKVKEDEPRDKWYFRVRKMKEDFEINIDPDLANEDALTIFINHRVYDYNGNYIGATGVGLTINSVKRLIDEYSKKYDRNIFFVNKQGKIILHNSVFKENAGNIHQVTRLAPIAEKLLANGKDTTQFAGRGGISHINSRYIPEMKWYLLVEQSEAKNVKPVFDAFVINLIICFVITVIVITLIFFTVKAYQRISKNQQLEISKQHQELLSKHQKLQDAMSEVKTLSGLLPICSCCKKIRNDEGYWLQLEEYFSTHTDTLFSHGLCPDCAKTRYPELYDEEKMKGIEQKASGQDTPPDEEKMKGVEQKKSDPQPPPSDS